MGSGSLNMAKFRIRIDFGDDGVVDLEKTGNIGQALRDAYEEALNRKQNPVAVNVQRIVNNEWIDTAPVAKAE